MLCLWLCAGLSERPPPGGQLTLTRLLPWEVNLTGSPRPVFAGVEGAGLHLVGAGEDNEGGPSERESSGSTIPRNLGPCGGRNPWLQVVRQ